VFSKETNTYVAIVEVADLVATLVDLYKELEASVDFHHLPQKLEERWNGLTVQYLLSHPGTFIHLLKKGSHFLSTHGRGQEDTNLFNLLLKIAQFKMPLMASERVAEG